MSTELAESLIAERVAQLDAIVQRRNALLRDMYHMIQQKHNVGVLFTLHAETDDGNEDEDEGLIQFLDKFDLSKNQESGFISNLSDSELSVPFPSEEISEEVDPVASDVDSPMSDPPASPVRAKSPVQKEEDEEAEINEVVEAAEEEMELPMSHSSTPSQQPPTETQEKEEEEEEEEGEEEEEEEEEQLVPTVQPASAVPSPRPPSRPVSVSSHHTPAESQHSSRLHSPPVLSQSPQHVSAEPISETVEMDTSDPMEDIREESPMLELPSSPVSEEPAETHVQSEDTVADAVAVFGDAPSPPSILEDVPRPMVIHTAVDVTSIQPSLLIPTPTSPAPPLPDFSFEETEGELTDEPPQSTLSTEAQHHHFNPSYNLPPLKVLFPECPRKGKSSKQKKKDRDKGDSKGTKEEWVPLGFVKWGAIVRANPIYKKVSRATKCLSTKDWSIATTELRLLRTLERVESLENVAKWSYRQPKKQRNLGGLTKTHWDYLLDEMKWLRVDFREERKWKYVLAFNISTAVIEWHEAETREERIKLGICMHWKRPRTTDSVPQQRRQPQDMEVDKEGACEQGDKEHVYSDQESGDDDDEGEVEQMEIVDALETRNVLEEALEERGLRSGSGESGESSQTQSVGPDGVLRPKVEDVEDSSALGNVSGAWQRDVDAMDVDGVRPGELEQDKAADSDAGKVTQITKTEVVDLAGLKPDSNDPILGSQPSSESQSSAQPLPNPSKSAQKSNLYAPLRERIAYSDDSKLFVDSDDFDLVKALSDLTTEDTASPVLDFEHTRSLDLSDLFPDLQPLGMPDVAPSEPRKRSDRKSERDDNRRVDDAGYTKIAPMGKFMLCKPTLLSPLQPVRRWKHGRWLPPEEPAVTEVEGSSSKITDEQLSDLFDGIKPHTVGGIVVPHPPKDNKKRLDHAWSPSEDALLKSLVEKYPQNWCLVTDSFNSARVTISIDKRSPWECFERWNLKFGSRPSGVLGHADLTSPIGIDGTPPPTTPSASSPQVQMTTRGVKRLANINVTQGQIGGLGPTGVTITSDTIKRRRHSLMYETIRKTAKKREAAQKAASLNQRKPPNIHDTHGQYNKMPKHTPAELSRMKAEKEGREQEMLIARRRHEELARQQLLRTQQTPTAVTGPAQQQPQSQQQQPQQPQQPQSQQQQPQQPQSQSQQPQQQQQPQAQRQPTGNGASRPATQPSQSVPQIRAPSTVPQVNISQQQRMPTPLSAAAAARMSPQQILQVQAAQARVSAITAVSQTQAQVHAQLQAQAQAQGTPQAALNSLPAGTLLSPPYHSRAATSSPVISAAQQASPPRTVVTPSNAAPPRPPSAQPQPPMSSPQIAGSTMPRPTSSIAAHYLPVVPPGAHFTQEQMDQALRLSSLMRTTTMTQAQQGGQYPSQG